MFKSPFLRMGLSSEGHVVNFLDPDGKSEVACDFDVDGNELIPVNVSFMGRTHFVVEENQNFVCFNDVEQRKCGLGRSLSSKNLSCDDCSVGEDVVGVESGSLPDRLMSDMYQHFANRTSPGSDKSRKQRRREKERMASRKWEPEHFVKIVHCAPSPSRPLQGLWKVLNLSFNLLCYAR